MIYIIDGHNLIPKVRGLSLEAIDDEASLIALLQNFTRVRKGRIEVFFDGAPVGHAGTRSYGTLKAHFIKIGSTADDAIRAHLDGLGAQASQVMVVTSDRQVQADVRKHHAGLITSEHFAEMLLDTQPAKPEPAAPPTKKQASHSDPNLDEWLRLFGEDPDQPTPASPTSSKQAAPGKHTPPGDPDMDEWLRLFGQEPDKPKKK